MSHRQLGKKRVLVRVARHCRISANLRRSSLAMFELSCQMSATGVCVYGSVGTYGAGPNSGSHHVTSSPRAACAQRGAHQGNRVKRACVSLSVCVCVCVRVYACVVAKAGGWASASAGVWGWCLLVGESGGVPPRTRKPMHARPLQCRPPAKGVLPPCARRVPPGRPRSWPTT